MAKFMLKLGLLANSLLVGNVLAIQIWPSPGAIPTTVPAACRAALVQNLTCTDYLMTAQKVADGEALVGDMAKNYCTKDCYSSLQTFQTNTESHCGDTLYTLYPNTTLQQSVSLLSNGLLWAYNVSCIQDSTGFCLADLYKGNKTACSDCSLKYHAILLASDYGRMKETPEQFESLLSSCGVPASSYTYSYTSIPTTTTSSSTSAYPSPTCAGSMYTVQSGDTCLSISKQNSVGTDRMIALNNLDYGCQLLQVGGQICIQDKCTIKTVEQNQTCDSFTQGQSFTSVQLKSWNPTISPDCGNIASMVGRSLCVSPPGSNGYNISFTTKPTTRPSLTSPLFSSWVSATTESTYPNFTTSWYTPPFDSSYKPNTTTTFPVNSTAISLVAQRTAYCWISQSDYDQGFRDYDLPEGCQDLISEYCYPDPDAPIPTSPSRIPSVCTPDMADYTVPPSDTPVPTPSPIQDSMVSGCTKFDLAVANDNCIVISNRNNITLANFYLWNPAVGNQCQNLWLAYYYCVQGPQDSQSAQNLQATQSPQPSQIPQAQLPTQTSQVLQTLPPSETSLPSQASQATQAPQTSQALQTPQGSQPPESSQSS